MAKIKEKIKIKRGKLKKKDNSKKPEIKLLTPTGKKRINKNSKKSIFKSSSSAHIAAGSAG